MLSPSDLVHRLSAVRSLALRRGVWLKASPTARALIESVVFHLKRGGRVKSPALLTALEEAVKEVLTLALPLRVKAKAIGYAIAKRLKIEIDEEKAVALGIQWINTPKRYRATVKSWTP
ncbi:MAG: hypothetical protein QXP98_03890 [Thermoproteus sp.]